jgi:L,D-peptidoglycan transpeptidase YkuD (ErfK/YbiS/YcfS/YnhG family)
MATDPIHVRSRPLDRRRGLIFAGGLVWPCALGRGGVIARKREGDGGSPRAALRVLRGFYRPDRLRRPVSPLPFAPLHPTDGWCDDPRHPRYNRPVRLPFSAGHERMWRDDHLYDVVVVLDWNMRPAIRGCGSAIFLHLARPGFAPTEGCVAVAPSTMRHLLRRLKPGSRLLIH